MKYIYLVLSLLTALVWLIALEIPDDRLHLIACDVGQGDAILAVYKNVQILTDGGPPNSKVLDCLSRYLPFWDRKIEVIVNTHPQLDHYGGLIEVFKRYRVENFLANGLDSSSFEYGVLKKEVGGSAARVVNPAKGTLIRYGLLSLDIFWPSFAFLASEGMPSVENKLGTFTSNRDANDFSIQAILSLGDFNALLTGDIGSNLTEEVIPNLPVHRIEYIKIPHHGSKNGMTSDYLNQFMPKVAVISVGRKNTYGHPTEEILKMLRDKDIQILRTDESGSIEIITDGATWEVAKSRR